MVQRHSFASGYSVVLATFAERNYSCSTELFATFENQLTVNVRDYFWTSSSIPLICMWILRPVWHSLDDCCSVISFEIRKCEPSYSVLLFQDCSGYSGSLEFHMNFKISLSISAKNAVEIFIGGWVESVD